MRERWVMAVGVGGVLLAIGAGLVTFRLTGPPVAAVPAGRQAEGPPAKAPAAALPIARPAPAWCVETTDVEDASYLDLMKEGGMITKYNVAEAEVWTYPDVWAACKRERNETLTRDYLVGMFYKAGAKVVRVLSSRDGSKLADGWVDDKGVFHFHLYQAAATNQTPAAAPEQPFPPAPPPPVRPAGGGKPDWARGGIAPWELQPGSTYRVDQALTVCPHAPWEVNGTFAENMAEIAAIQEVVAGTTFRVEAVRTPSGALCTSDMNDPAFCGQPWYEVSIGGVECWVNSQCLPVGVHIQRTAG